MSKSRKSQFDGLSKESFDLIIIGGGITGAGIALDASSRGLKVALVEKKDFASGTSSKSTKLIHGGLRYLKQLNFGLVAKTGRERSIIHNIAPHLVLPDKMLLPFYDGGTFGKFTTRLALFMYDTLAGVSGGDKFKIYSKRKTKSLVPTLDQKGLRGSGFYAEYRTDDARLTIEIIKKAKEFGAICMNYCKCTDFIYEGDQVSGIKATNVESGQSIEIKATKIVNAAGPWVDAIRNLDKEGEGDKKLVLSKGVHLVFDREKFPLDHTVYFDKGDGRLIFAIPRINTVYIGTTDTIHPDSPDELKATAADVDYIMEAIQAKFSSLGLTKSDILSSWAGVRPLIYEEGKDVTEISRKDEIFIAESGLITIAGGKLTGYRHMAMDIIETFIDDIDGSFNDCRTDKIKLTDKPFKNYKEVEIAVEKLAKTLSKTNLPKWVPPYLIYNYGNVAFDIIAQIDTKDINLESITITELNHTIEHESVVTLLDFYERRTGRLYFEIASIIPTLDVVADTARKRLDWTHDHLKQEKQSVIDAIHAQTTFS